MKNKLRKQINRSGKIACPICLKKEILVEHHIHGRSVPNAEHSSNKSYICSNCHRKIHEGIIILEGWVSTTSGLVLFWHKENEEGFTGNDAKPYIYRKKTE